MAEKKYIKTLERYIDKTARQFTLNDAAAVTGLPVLETEYALKDLMKVYDCKLNVTEGGDIIYDFGNMNRRAAKSFQERMQELGAWLWKGFTIFYKFTISIILLIYFVVFVVILIALVVAALSGGKDNRGGGKGAGNLLALLARIFFSIFQWRTIMGMTYSTYDSYGYRYQHYEPRKPILGNVKGGGRKKKGAKSSDKAEQAKRFVSSIYDFVFGPPRVKPHELANEQEVASFLRTHKGLINIAELQALAGWNRENAGNFMTKCLGIFDGDAKISANATLYGDFSELLRSKSEEGQAPVIYYWDEYEPEYELTGNSAGRNVAIMAINGFNLLFAGVILFSDIPMELGLGAGLLWLGWIPFVYSMLFFLIPIFRWFSLQPKRREQHRINIRKRIYKAIFQEGTAQVSLKRLENIANATIDGEEKLSDKVIEKEMKDVIYELGGESFVDDEAKIQYRFERLDRELKDIEALRKEKRDDSDLGDVVFKA